MTTQPTSETADPAMPGAAIDLDKVPGHWLLARMGKRVLRPGGRELTDELLGHLAVTHETDVVEFAPGLGATTRLLLDGRPRTYTGIERDEDAAARVRTLLSGADQSCIVASAAQSGLADGSASVVFGEAYLTMQPEEQKRHVLDEAYRLLRPGGRFGLHELCLRPDTLDAEHQRLVRSELSRAISVGARPLTVADWRAALEAAGFEITNETTTPMHLLEPRRAIADEGIGGTIRIAFNVARTPAARRRVGAMRAAFRRHADQLGAIGLIATKPDRGG
ncbi:MAG: methyltransferase domain-containing protein [Actinomycetota bacterium]